MKLPTPTPPPHCFAALPVYPTTSVQWLVKQVILLFTVSGIAGICCLKGVPILIHLGGVLIQWTLETVRQLPVRSIRVSGISRIHCLKGVPALIHLWMMKRAVPLFTVSGISRIHCLKGVTALIHLWVMKRAIPLFTVSGISRIHCLKGVPILIHLGGVLIQWTLETVRQLPRPTVSQEVASASTIWLRSDALILILPGPEIIGITPSCRVLDFRAKDFPRTEHRGPAKAQPFGCRDDVLG